MMISVSDREENIMGRGKNAGYQHFLLFMPASSIDRGHTVFGPSVCWSAKTFTVAISLDW